MRVAVLGAGVVGVTSAWYLAEAGHEVVVIDRGAAPASETSHANGGQISVSHAEPWANPHTPLKALQWLGREDAPLLFRLRWDPALFAWSARFLRECTPARTAANIRAIVALALDSRRRLKTLRQALQAQGPFDYQHAERGILHFYTDPREFDAACAASALMRTLGCQREQKTADECLAIEPALDAMRGRIVGGDYTAADESGDARRFTELLAERLAARGVEFRFGSALTRLLRDGDRVFGAEIGNETLRADAFVLALGCDSPRLAASLGIRLPVYPAKGYSITVQLSADSVAPSVSLTDDECKLVFSRFGQRLRVAGTAEFAGYDRGLNTVRGAALLRRTHELFPRLRPAAAPEHWAGLRPATPSNVPLIGRRGYRNLILNTGHGTLGWTLACGSAAAVAALVAGERPEPAFPFLSA